MKEFDGNMEIRLVGVSINKLIDPRKEPIQMSIFDTEETLPEDKTHDLIDEINSKLRKPLLKRASEAENRKKGK